MFYQNKRIDFSDAIVFNYQHPVNCLKKMIVITNITVFLKAKRLNKTYIKFKVFATSESPTKTSVKVRNLTAIVDELEKIVISTKVVQAS